MDLNVTKSSILVQLSSPGEKIFVLATRDASSSYRIKHSALQPAPNDEYESTKEGGRLCPCWELKGPCCSLNRSTPRMTHCRGSVKAKGCSDLCDQHASSRKDRGFQALSKK